MKKKLLFVFISIMIFFIFGCSDDSINNDEADADYVYLKNAPFFSDGMISNDDDDSEAIYAVRRLYQKENALDYFLKLESEANYEGKMYALCGLFYLNYDNWDYLMDKYENSREKINYQSGSELIENYCISDIIKSNEINAVRFRDNNDTISEWFRRNSYNSFCMDFYGGSIPFTVMGLLINGDFYESEGTQFIENAKFNFSLALPSSWIALGNSDGYIIGCWNDYIDMRVYGSHTIFEQDYYLNTDDDSEVTDFLFDSGIKGWQKTDADTYIEFFYCTDDRYVSFYINYKLDRLWFTENEEKIIAIAKTLRDGNNNENVTATNTSNNAKIETNGSILSDQLGGYSFFEYYSADENSYHGYLSKGDVIIKFQNLNGKIITTWGEITPLLYANEAPGNYFIKNPNMNFSLTTHYKTVNSSLVELN